MILTEMDFGGRAQPVESYGPGFFRVAGVRIDGAMVATAAGVRAWGGWEDRAFGDIDVLLVGTGRDIVPVPAAFRTALEGQGVGVDFMASAAACRVYNVLLAEGRRVALAALPL